MNAMPYKAAVIVQDDCLHAELLSCVDVNSVSLLSRPQGRKARASWPPLAVKEDWAIGAVRGPDDLQSDYS